MSVFFSSPRVLTCVMPHPPSQGLLSWRAPQESGPCRGRRRVEVGVGGVTGSLWSRPVDHSRGSATALMIYPVMVGGDTCHPVLPPPPNPLHLFALYFYLSLGNMVKGREFLGSHVLVAGLCLWLAASSPPPSLQV